MLNLLLNLHKDSLLLSLLLWCEVLEYLFNFSFFSLRLRPLGNLLFLKSFSLFTVWEKVAWSSMCLIKCNNSILFFTWLWSCSFSEHYWLTLYRWSPCLLHHSLRLRSNLCHYFWFLFLLLSLLFGTILNGLLLMSQYLLLLIDKEFIRDAVREATCSIESLK